MAAPENVLARAGLQNADFWASDAGVRSQECGTVYDGDDVSRCL